MPWYTTQKVAKRLKVTVRTVERWRESGYFVPVERTSGNHSRYSEEQVCELENRRLLEQMIL